MLRLDPSTNLPVADAVWKAVDSFLTEYYGTYPDSNVAVVSFGTNGNKSDNWKYFNNLEDAIEEFVNAASAAYEKECKLKLTWFEASPSEGTSIVKK